jgi:hypothetical protein
MSDRILLLGVRHMLDDLEDPAMNAQPVKEV